MRWYLLGGAILVIVASALFFLFRSPQQNTVTLNPSTGLPIASSTVSNGTSVSGPTTSIPAQPVMSVGIQGGGSIVVSDFVHNGETVEDVVNPGSYVLAGSLGYCLANGTCLSGAPSKDFSVSYNSINQFFNIILLSEPIGPVRSEAEQFVLARLGVSPQQACSLNYYVGTPYWVNAAYDDRNLGFSFCPGAAKLPN